MSPEAPAIESQMRNALGESWFFDRERDRECIALDVALEELRSPAPFKNSIQSSEEE
jgi:hypothetical protein